MAGLETKALEQAHPGEDLRAGQVETHPRLVLERLPSPQQGELRIDHGGGKERAGVGEHVAPRQVRYLHPREVDGGTSAGRYRLRVLAMHL